MFTTKMLTIFFKGVVKGHQKGIRGMEPKKRESDQIFFNASVVFP